LSGTKPDARSAPDEHKPGRVCVNRHGRAESIRHTALKELFDGELWCPGPESTILSGTKPDARSAPEGHKPWKVCVNRHDCAEPARSTVLKNILRWRIMVPRAGVEPARCYHRGILSPLRLPISPPGRWV
jgi:hypothetical protein